MYPIVLFYVFLCYLNLSYEVFKFHFGKFVLEMVSHIRVPSTKFKNEFAGMVTVLVWGSILIKYTKYSEEKLS